MLASYRYSVGVVLVWYRYSAELVSMWYWYSVGEASLQYRCSASVVSVSVDRYMFSFANRASIEKMNFVYIHKLKPASS